MKDLGWRGSVVKGVLVRGRRPRKTQTEARAKQRLEKWAGGVTNQRGRTSLLQEKAREWVVPEAS